MGMLFVVVFVGNSMPFLSAFLSACCIVLVVLLSVFAISFVVFPVFCRYLLVASSGVSVLL